MLVQFQKTPSQLQTLWLTQDQFRKSFDESQRWWLAQRLKLIPHLSETVRQLRTAKRYDKMTFQERTDCYANSKSLYTSYKSFKHLLAKQGAPTAQGCGSTMSMVGRSGIMAWHDHHLVE
jgi:hypothetical protein